MEYAKIRAIVAKCLGISEDEISPHSSFVEDLGADSLEIFEIVLAVENEFDLVIEQDITEEIETVEDAVSMLQDALEGR